MYVAVQELGSTESEVVDRNIVEVVNIFHQSHHRIQYWLPTLQVQITNHTVEQQRL